MKALSCSRLSDESEFERFTKYLKNTVDKIVTAELSGDYSMVINLSANAIQYANKLADLKADS